MPYSNHSTSHVQNKVSQIFSIISAYRYRSATIPDRFSEFAPDLKKQLSEAVSCGQTVRFILPAFPFNFTAKGDSRKTLGSLPDKAEAFALQTLDGLADSIAETYAGGATVVIVSDVFRENLKIPDADVFAYHQELKALALSLGLTHLEFVRLGTVVRSDLEEYFDNACKTCNLLDGPLAQAVELEGNESHATLMPHINDTEAFKPSIFRQRKSIIRLSIHESNNVGKITLDLFPPSTNPGFLTPWHCAVAVLADASVRIIDISTVDLAKFEVITNHMGRPWLLREKSDLFDWGGMELDFEPLFPCGMLVRARAGCGPYKFEDVNMNRVRQLALSTAPLLLRGFTMQVEKEVFRNKARELGSIQMWPFGDILEVRENADLSVMNVLTREAMPFHYDGCFKTVKDEKTGGWIPTPPLFQMFRNHAASQSKGGLTLFTSSRNLIPLLGPDTVPLEELRRLKWKTFTTDKEAFGSTQLLRPFIIPHPETGVDVFRFHEPWPESKCAPGSGVSVHVLVQPQAKGNAISESLTRLMYDRRVAYRHHWKEGDFIFNDNAMTHHTRTAFENGHREHWRVHVN